MDTHTVLRPVERDLHLHNARLVGRLSVTVGYGWCREDIRPPCSVGVSRLELTGGVSSPPPTTHNHLYTHTLLSNYLFKDTVCFLTSIKSFLDPR